MCVSACLCVCTCTSVCVCMPLCICVCVPVCLCESVHTCVCAYLCVYVCTPLCMLVCMCLFVCVRVCLCMYVHACVSVHTYVRTHVPLCMCVPLCVPTLSSSAPPLPVLGSSRAIAQLSLFPGRFRSCDSPSGTPARRALQQVVRPGLPPTPLPGLVPPLEEPPGPGGAELAPSAWPLV